MPRPDLPALLVLAGCGDADVAVFEVVVDLPDARMDHPYQGRLAAEGARGDVAFEIARGELPPGLTLDPGGAVSGTPEAWGEYGFTVAAADASDEVLADLELAVLPVVLLSGFEPFDDFETNSSWEALVPLEDQVIAGLDVRTVLLPVEWDTAWAVLEPEIEAYDPVVALGTGQAGWFAMRFETTARNVQRGTDEVGVEREGEAVVPGGPETLPSALPIDEMRGAMEAAGFVVRTSDDAGTYLCNDIFYHLETEARASGRVAGFVHVPPPDAEAFPIADVTEAHRVGLEALAAWLAAGAPRRAARVDLHEAPWYRRAETKR